LSDIHAEAITSRQWRIKAGITSVIGLSLLVAFCAFSAQSDFSYWGSRMLMALALLPL
jgi:hypothetical protein